MMLLPDGRRFVCAGGDKISVLEHGLALNLK